MILRAVDPLELSQPAEGVRAGDGMLVFYDSMVLAHMMSTGSAVNTALRATVGLVIFAWGHILATNTIG